MVWTVKITEHLKDFVDDLANTCCRSVHFVDDNEGTNFLFECLSEDEFSLCHRSLCGTYDKADPINHVHDALDLSSEVLMARSVDYVDAVVMVCDVGALGAD